MPNQKSNYQNRTSNDHFSPYSKSELRNKLGAAPGHRGSGSRESADQVRAVLSDQRVNLTMAALAIRHSKRERQSAPEPAAPGSLGS